MGARISGRPVVKPKVSPKLFLVEVAEVFRLSTPALIRKLVLEARSNPALSFGKSVDLSNLRSPDFGEEGSTLEDLLIDWEYIAKDETERAAGRLLLACLDENGFLSEDAVSSVARSLSVSSEFVERVRIKFKGLSVVGVGARDMFEAVRWQAEAEGVKDAPLIEAVLRTVWKIGDVDIKKVAEGLGIPEGKVKEALEVARRFDPYPGRKLKGALWGDPIYLREDIRLCWDGERFSAKLLFPLSEVVRVVKNGSRDQIYRAMRVVSYVHIRDENLRRLAEIVANRQADFLLGKGPKHSLLISEVAEEIGISIYAASRLISGKNVSFGNRIFPLRSLFSRYARFRTDRAEILKALEGILRKYPKASDRELSEALRGMGFKASRRTVNNYRRMLRKESL